MLNRCCEYAFLELVRGADIVVVGTAFSSVEVEADICEEGGGCCS